MAQNIARIGVSIPNDLIEKFDKFIGNRGYSNRSKAICDLIRDRLTQDEWEAGNKEVVGAVSLVYDHHTRELSKTLTTHQHKHHEYIIATTHIHIDEHNCLEIISMKGPGNEIRKLGETLIATRGVLHGKMIFTTTGKDFHHHPHHHEE